MDLVEQVWHKDFERVHDAIPASWVCTADDGFMYIHPDHRDDPMVKMYHSLCCVGFARGWM